MTEKEQYWSEHLVAIAAEQITTKAYAEREGLSAASLYSWRNRLNARHASQSGSSRQLVPVRLATSGGGNCDIACTLTLGPSVHLELPRLPDPHWLARVVSATTD